MRTFLMANKTNQKDYGIKYGSVHPTRQIPYTFIISCYCLPFSFLIIFFFLWGLHSHLFNLGFYPKWMCVWVLGGLWKLIYESTTFLFSCHLSLEWFAGLGLFFYLRRIRLSMGEVSISNCWSSTAQMTQNWQEKTGDWRSETAAVPVIFFPCFVIGLSYKKKKWIK